MGVGLSLYGLAALYQYISRDPIIKHMIKCRYCRKRINEKVRDHSPYLLCAILWLTKGKALRCTNCSSVRQIRVPLSSSCLGSLGSCLAPPLEAALPNT